MRRKLLRTYCMLVTQVSFYFYLTKFEPNLDMKAKAFATFFLIQKSNIIYHFFFFMILKGHFSIFDSLFHCLLNALFVFNDTFKIEKNNLVT